MGSPAPTDARLPARPATEDDAWRAVTRRDASADGAFVYAVRTTGVYCRPSCPARRPRRANVLFFSSPLAAVEAGFRSCRRCHPDRAADPAPDPIERARGLVVGSGEGPGLTLERLAAAVGLSPFHLQRRFKERFGLSPRELLSTLRVERLRGSLRRGATVGRATYDAGFGSGSRVYERAGAIMGMTPARYARGGGGTTIRYTVVPSALGKLLVAVTDRGVCAVSLGRDEAALERELRLEFPAARIDRVDRGADVWLGRLVRRVERVIARPGHRAAPGIPLDLRGTAFELRIWKALLEIPAGVTSSYAEIARRVGRPSAARAVARACARNRVALLVPCHRVVRADGSPGGYRWGLPAKRALLEREEP
jgi:AraC family transcriptional regulator of adaptative response/methylated-DNA-[protein]-cysteine methyltransferase